MNYFNEWNELKQKLQIQNKKLSFKEGDIWWCSVGHNIGTEIYGKGSFFRRPVLVIKKLSSHSCVVVPVTTKGKEGSWYFKFHIVNLGDRWFALHQIKHISINRLSSFQVSLPKNIFIQIKKSLTELLGLS